MTNDPCIPCNSTGTCVASYTWGEHTVTNYTTANIGNINTFRYRGYYFDTETGFYYLNARYYDPQIKRLINADIDEIEKLGGAMGYKMSMPIGMLFRKMYCHSCGNRLERHRLKKVYKAGDPEFERLMMGDIINIKQQTIIEYIYKCPMCQRLITYEAQTKIAKIQKNLSKRVLTEEEIKNGA